jgi:hypothetical protein
MRFFAPLVLACIALWAILVLAFWALGRKE